MAASKTDFTIYVAQDEEIDLQRLKVGQPIEIQRAEGDDIFTCRLANGTVLGPIPRQHWNILEKPRIVCAEVRSIIRTSDGRVTKVLVRLRFAARGQDDFVHTRKGDEEEENNGHLLLLSELESIGYCQTLKEQLRSSALQKVLQAIDSSSDRDKALAVAIDAQPLSSFVATVEALIDLKDRDAT